MVKNFIANALLGSPILLTGPDRHSPRNMGPSCIAPPSPKSGGGGGGG